MKLKIMVLLIAIGFFFVGCASDMMGKQVPVTKLRNLSFERTFTFVDSGDVVTFSFEGDKFVGKLVFGKLRSNPGYEIRELTLVAWFTDFEGVIIAKESYSWESGAFDTNEELKFVMDMPQGYKKFVYVGFSYSGTYYW
jgi:hypothetical protein